MREIHAAALATTAAARGYLAGRASVNEVLAGLRVLLWAVREEQARTGELVADANGSIWEHEVMELERMVLRVARQNLRAAVRVAAGVLEPLAGSGVPKGVVA